jgi:Domain of unknown function (DUF4430)
VRGTPRGPVPLLTALAVLLALVLLAGCERRAQLAPVSSAPGAGLVATEAYGAHELLSTRVPPGGSVMRALRGATQVDTAYSGGFVQGMLGRASDPSGPRDWFFYVDGIGSSVGAKDVPVRDGDAIWWDFRDWGALAQAPAVVGQWPAPFARPGAPAVSADPPLRAALAARGAPIASGDSPWRVRVGASADLARRDPAWKRALADPDAAGLTVAIEGGRVTALGPDGGGRAPVPGARALVAAVPTAARPEEGVLMAVAGLDGAAAEAAARTVAADPGVLRLSYAVAFDGAGRPLASGGRWEP